jgi:ATP-binding cassette subfamily B protein
MDIKIKQHDITDCGAACLASVCAHYKFKLPISRIRQLAGTDKKGTNALGMITAAEKLGFEAKGVEGGMNSLSKIPIPAIAHVIVNEVMQHYVVIYKVTDKYVQIMDPGDGKMHTKPLNEFAKEWTGVMILMLPNQNFESKNEKVSNLARFFFLLKPHKSILFQALLGAIIYTVLGLSTSIYIQKLTDFVLVDGNKNLLNLLSVGMIVLILFQVFLGASKSVMILKTGQLIDSRLILGYYKHLLKLPQRFFDTMRIGEIISRINDAVKIRAFINDTAISLIVNVFIVFFSFALMFIYSWKLALAMALIIPLYSLVYFITNRLNKKQERKVMEKAADLETQLVESLNSVKTIKQLSLEDFANIKTETRFVNLLHSGYKSGLNSVFSGNSSEFLSRIFTIVLLWFGGYLVIDQTITPGELMSFYAIIGYFTGPVASLIDMNKSIQNALIAADRLFDIMDLEREKEENMIEVEKSMAGDVFFQDVSFSYGTRVDVFENFSLRIPHGKITAIIGESGSGKTTIAALLQKLYPLNDGNIYIGAMNTKYISRESLRKYVGIVPQNLNLFAGNVIENIAVGELQPNMKRILDICKQLGLLDFIEELPDGFYTWLGENGASLSGGQKQRLAIARALYRDPQVLILDEATSSLDSISEEQVQTYIRKLREEGKTIILIAHRLGTVLQSDKIIVLEKGKLMEEGSHAELYEKRGKYYNMWQKQMPKDYCVMSKT